MRSGFRETSVAVQSCSQQVLRSITVAVLPLLALGAISTGALAAEVIHVVRKAETRLEVSADVGQFLEITTAPRPFTAYRWDVRVETPGGPDVASLLKREDIQTSSNAAPGGPSSTVFVFHIDRAGIIRLLFNYFAGPNYPGFDVADSFVVNIIAR